MHQSCHPHAKISYRQLHWVRRGALIDCVCMGNKCNGVVASLYIQTGLSFDCRGYAEFYANITTVFGHGKQICVVRQHPFFCDLKLNKSGDHLTHK